MGEAKRRKSAGARVLRRLTIADPVPALTRLIIPAGAGFPASEIAVRALAAAEATRRRVRHGLRAASAVGSIDAMLEAIERIGAVETAAYEDAMQQHLASDAEGRAEMDRIECRRGCAFCCHVAVTVTPLEALRLAAAMRRGLIPDRTAAVAAATANRGAGSRAARMTPCPLLVDDACSAYGLRPLACRSLFSTSAKRCEAGFAGAVDGVAAGLVPSLTWPRFLTISHLTGEVAALRDLGLAAHMVELRAALAVLIGDETAFVRWHNGEDVLPASGGP